MERNLISQTRINVTPFWKNFRYYTMREIPSQITDRVKRASEPAGGYRPLLLPSESPEPSTLPPESAVPAASGPSSPSRPRVSHSRYGSFLLLSSRPSNGSVAAQAVPVTCLLSARPVPAGSSNHLFPSSRLYATTLLRLHLLPL